jgi:hypothetical protein
MKVLHLPTSVGGNSSALAWGERALGLHSDVLASTRNWLAYPADINLDLQSLNSNPRKFLRLAGSFLKYRKAYDVFHFNAGSTLFFSPPHGAIHWDLPWYPYDAKLFATYNGCDARQKFATMRRTAVAPCHNARCYHGMCNYGAHDALRAQAIIKMAKYVRHIWAVTPDLLHFLPPSRSSFLPYAIRMPDEPVASPDLDRKKLRIIHAPTNREAKGSEFILDALNRLRLTHGNLFEFQLIERTPHKIAMQLYREADLVVDQVVISWYGGFAVEVMAMGKPVVSGRVLEDSQFVDPLMAKEVANAVICADPSSIYDVLKRCLEDRAMLKQYAGAGLEYARKWHDPRRVAEITKGQYERT